MPLVSIVSIVSVSVQQFDFFLTSECTYVPKRPLAELQCWQSNFTTTKTLHQQNFTTINLTTTKLYNNKTLHAWLCNCSAPWGSGALALSCLATPCTDHLGKLHHLSNLLQFVVFSLLRPKWQIWKARGDRRTKLLLHWTPLDVCRSEMGTSHPLGVMRTFLRLESSHQMINTESQISVRIISEGLPGIKVTWKVQFAKYQQISHQKDLLCYFWFLTIWEPGRVSPHQLA